MDCLSFQGLKILHDLGVVVSPTSIIKKRRKKTTCKTAIKQIIETVTRCVNHKQEFTGNASGLSPTAGLESDTEVTSLAACVESETADLPCHAAVTEVKQTQHSTILVVVKVVQKSIYFFLLHVKLMINLIQEIIQFRTLFQNQSQ